MSSNPDGFQRDRSNPGSNLCSNPDRNPNPSPGISPTSPGSNPDALQGRASSGNGLSDDAVLGSPVPRGTRPVRLLSWPTVRYMARSIGISVVFYLSILTLVLIAMTVLLNILDKDDLISIGDGEMRIGILAYDTVLMNSNAIFLLVTGICFPFMLEVLLSNGVTRRQFSISLMAVALGFSLTLTLVQTVAALLLGNFDLLALVVGVVSNYCAWMLGWMTAVGFQLRRVVTATAGILIACAAVMVVSVPILSASSNWTVSLSAEPLLEFAITLAIIIILTLALPAISKRVPIKC
jgi:hypothetical protein